MLARITGSTKHVAERPNDQTSTTGKAMFINSKNDLVCSLK